MDSVQELLGDSNWWTGSTSPHGRGTSVKAAVRVVPLDLGGPSGSTELTTVVGASAGEGRFGTCSVTAALLRILITHFAGGMR